MTDGKLLVTGGMGTERKAIAVNEHGEIQILPDMLYPHKNHALAASLSEVFVVGGNKGEFKKQQLTKLCEKLIGLDRWVPIAKV